MKLLLFNAINFLSSRHCAFEFIERLKDIGKPIILIVILNFNYNEGLDN